MLLQQCCVLFSFFVLAFLVFAPSFPHLQYSQLLLCLHLAVFPLSFPPPATRPLFLPGLSSLSKTTAATRRFTSSIALPDRTWTLSGTLAWVHVNSMHYLNFALLTGHPKTTIFLLPRQTKRSCRVIHPIVITFWSGLTCTGFGYMLRWYSWIRHLS